MATASTRTDPMPLGLQRLAAASGIGFAILFLAAIILGGASTPDEDAAAGAWQTFAVDNEERLRFATLAILLATYLFVLFLGFLRSHMGDAERAARGFTRGSHWILIGGTLGIGGLAIGVAIGAAAVGNEDAPGAVIEAVSDLAGSGFGLAAAGFAAMLIATGILNRTLRALPGWLGILALVTGVFFILQLGVLLTRDEDSLFGIFFPLGFLGLFVFTIAASVTFLQRLSGGTRGSASPPAAAPAP